MVKGCKCSGNSRPGNTEACVPCRAEMTRSGGGLEELSTFFEILMPGARSHEGRALRNEGEPASRSKSNELMQILFRLTSARYLRFLCYCFASVQTTSHGSGQQSQALRRLMYKNNQSSSISGHVSSPTSRPFPSALLHYFQWGKCPPRHWSAWSLGLHPPMATENIPATRITVSDSKGVRLTWNIASVLVLDQHT